MKQSITIWLIAMLIGFFTACEPKPEEVKPQAQETNPVKPDANDIINYQAFIGSEADKMTIMNMVERADGNMYFVAAKGSNYVIGLMTSTGTISWEKNTNFVITDIIPVTTFNSIANSTTDEGVVLVGQNSDATRGVIAFYDKFGTFKSDLLFADYAKMFFNTAIGGTDGVYAALGGAGGSDADIAPVSALFVLSTTTGTLSKTLPAGVTVPTISVFSNFKAYRFGRRSKIQGDIPPTDVNYPNPGNPGDGSSTASSTAIFPFNDYLTVYNKQGDFYRAGVCMVSVGTNGAASIDWLSDIVSESSLYQTFGYEVLRTSTHLYLIGYADAETDKNPKTSSGYWTNGLVAKLDLTGKIEWTRSIKMSKHADYFRSGFFEPNSSGGKFYVVGMASSFLKTTTNEVFGLGAICEIDANTGNLVRTKLFGSDLYRSAFRTVIGNTSELRIGGFTKEYKNTSDATYQGWFVKVLRSSL